MFNVVEYNRVIKMLSKGNDGRNQGEIIYIDDLVPKEHLLRKIDVAVDFTKIYEIVEDLYCKTNGYSKKTVKTQLGEVDVKIPRDRNGEYEPQIIEKYHRNADGMEEKILALYSCGMSQRDISEQIKNLYNVEISGLGQ